MAAIRNKGTVREKYKRWQNEMNKIINRCTKKINKNKASNKKPIRKLMKLKRSFKVKAKQCKKKIERKLARMQEKLIDEYIIEEKKREEGSRIKNTVEDIKAKGGVNGPAFWEFKSRMDGKKMEEPCAIRTEEGKIIEDLEEIKKEYMRFYTDLFKIDSAENEIEAAAEDINTMYYNWLKRSERVACEKLEKVETKEIEEIIKGLKNKHTPDKQGINNVIIKSMGSEIIESITEIVNLIEKEVSSPEEWEEIKILSHHKKGSKMELNNRRGIFITSNISKIYEKARMRKMKDELDKKMSRFQCGGLEGRSTVDHLLTLNAVVDYNKYIGAPTYVVFGDAYKCFDKLDIKDCVKELGKIVGWKEALLTLKTNDNGKASIECPAGETETINIKENVRQGTIYGPKLCGIVTDKINEISRKKYNPDKRHRNRNINIC